MKLLILKFIRLYQKTLSYDHGLMGKIFPNTRVCRYDPSCSQYTYEAVEKFGLLKGGWLGVKRVSRCHQWSNHPHYDPVPDNV